MKFFRKLLRFIGLFLLAIVLFLGAVYLFVPAPPEQQLVWQADFRPSPLYDPAAFGKAQQDSLMALCGSKKVLPKGYEIQTLLALAHYPELYDARMDFYLLPAAYPLASRPEYLTLLGSRAGRQYNVFLSTDTGTPVLNEINLDKLPFNAQVAILAHELGHSVYYQRQSVWQMLKFPMKFFTENSYRATHERTTDAQVVYHGLGLHLRQYTEFTKATFEKNADKLPPEFKASMSVIQSFYLDAAGVDSVMALSPAYAPAQ